MGQYYIPYLLDKEGSIRTLYSHDYGNGLKLMEHSYIGNDFVNAVLTLIENEPMRVGWVGDYSCDVDCADDVYDACWRDEDEHMVKVDPKPFMFNGEEPFGEGYYINHDKKEYISLADYAPLVTDKFGFKINPLPILTSIGNGMGGGDYRGINMDSVGAWHLDTIEYVHELSEDVKNSYSDETEYYVFKESRSY